MNLGTVHGACDAVWAVFVLAYSLLLPLPLALTHSLPRSVWRSWDPGALLALPVASIMVAPAPV